MEQNRNMAWNQLGFLPGARKEVTLFDAEGESRIDLKEQGSDKIVASFDLEKPRMNADTGNVCSRGDFSAFKDQGTFYLQAGDHKSEPFTIGEDVYDQVLSELIYMLHLQRCGCELTSEEAGEFAHASCHDTPARIYGTDETMDATGGWHDAGDYGRYIVPAAKTVVDLLMAYAHYQEVMEKNNPKKGPALLDEVRYEIDWMLKMQRADGGVYHKVTCASFPDMDIMPEEEREELIVCPVSNASTACFAASLSYATTIYKKTDAAYADRLLKAAESAYTYLSEHMDAPGFHNPEGIVTGEYGDENWIDDYFW
nr:glycoside hydrolase family 9 protein [Lachnospiraceae bacterium]